MLGIYKDLSNEAYHGHKESLSRSSIMDFDKSPYYYWSKHINPYRPIEKSKNSWEIGTAFHMMVLEPKNFVKDYAILSEGFTLRPKKNKELYAELLKDNKLILKYEDLKKLEGMFNSLKRNEKAFDLLINGTYEQSYFWHDKETNLLLKSRPDILTANGYVDLKTVTSASKRAYEKEMFDFGYHIQAAMVKDAVLELENRELTLFANICVEKEYPYQIGIKVFSDELINFATTKYKGILKRMKECFDKNEWPSYQPELVNLPNWAS